MSNPLDDDLLSALALRAEAAIEVLARRGVQSPIPWPSPSVLATRQANRADFFLSLAHVAWSAVALSGEGLSRDHRAEADAACERLFLIGMAFDLVNVAAAEPSAENLASLIFLGARLERLDNRAGGIADLLHPKPRRGRPAGSGYERKDRPFVAEATERLIAGEPPETVWPDVGMRAAMRNVSLESTIARLKGRLRQENK